MSNFFNENPFTLLFAAIGLVMGLLLPSGLEVLANVNYANPNIAETVTTIFSAYFIEAISGIMGTAIGILIGSLIDLSSGTPSGYY